MDIAFTAGKYLTWGVVSISVTNLVVILVMIVVFVLALVLPFPHGQAEATAPAHDRHIRSVSAWHRRDCRGRLHPPRFAPRSLAVIAA